ncbi:glycosyltransferase family 2 protein [uncultured Pseudodesulfovibrio sp.]|uniref:glycosyltransferase family 2 protein n=1 Tax=uncultured Pseudodesulfovibrio sp. TaxID=2035858 RepID=UPI0029C85331|nr:glycosyltransferase family 2 protein [uncultured Pseudodesulfovibrio sp.]
MERVTTDGLTGFWLSLPEELKAKLRLGFVGKRHLLEIAGWCLRSGDSALMPIAVDALETVVRENPLDGRMAAELLALDMVKNVLPPETMAKLTLVADHYRAPGSSDPYLKLRDGRDFPAIKKHIRSQIGKEPGNLYWREQALIVGVFENDMDFCVECISFDTFHGVESVNNSALRHVRSLSCSEKATENDLLLKRVAAAPWNIGLALRTYDALTGVADMRTALPGSVAVLLYSWNKADELDATLASMLESELLGVSIFVLDNGSTDRTAEVLAEWEPRFATKLGADRFTVISLPVNVGAASARNWLLHMDAVQQHAFICYLDDDVELPTDWLSRFGAAVQQYPEAGVWGCKVVDHANQLRLQSADSHLLAEPDTIVNLAKLAPNPFRLSDLHVQTLDTGVFDFMRPCASVTGCCHLFRTETLLESGDFAIQLSPSQYDDMEHDIRLCEAGLFPVYQGHLAVRHMKRTGMASHGSMQEEGNALGNKYKMQTMHGVGEVCAAARAEQAVLEADILMKLKFLEEMKK